MVSHGKVAKQLVAEAEAAKKTAAYKNRFEVKVGCCGVTKVHRSLALSPVLARPAALKFFVFGRRTHSSFT